MLLKDSYYHRLCYMDEFGCHLAASWAYNGAWCYRRVRWNLKL